MALKTFKLLVSSCYKFHACSSDSRYFVVRHHKKYHFPEPSPPTGKSGINFDSTNDTRRLEMPPPSGLCVTLSPSANFFSPYLWVSFLCVLEEPQFAISSHWLPSSYRKPDPVRFLRFLCSRRVAAHGAMPCSCRESECRGEIRQRKKEGISAASENSRENVGVGG